VGFTVNPHVAHRTSPLAIIDSVRNNANLIYELTRREVLGKYKGAWLGIFWAVAIPLALLGVYTFVFGVVMKVRWAAGAGETQVDFALLLFVGMLIHNLFSECVGKAPELILTNATFVKKVVFPLEILPLASVLSALFHMAVALLVFLAVLAVSRGGLFATAFLFPLVILPAVLFTLGLTWALASFGVYFRDIGQAASLIVLLFLFLSPVFYPIAALPTKFRTLIHLNPLTFPIEAGRAVLIYGRPPEWSSFAWNLLLGTFMAWVGFWWFQKTRKGFADVV
jgi:lipopolysaccharide transport system permease protein